MSWQNFSEDIVHKMNDPIGCLYPLCEEHPCIPCTGLDGYAKIILVHHNLVTPSCLNLGGSLRYVFILQLCSHHMSQQNRGQVISLGQECGECFFRQFLESLVYWSKYCERSLARQSFYQVSRLYGRDQGGEVGGGVQHLQYGLGRGDLFTWYRARLWCKEWSRDEPMTIGKHHWEGWG